MYNMLGKIGINIELELVCELLKIKNIVGIKDSSGKFDNMKVYIEVMKNENFSVFLGLDLFILDSLKVGS